MALPQSSPASAQKLSAPTGRSRGCGRRPPTGHALVRVLDRLAGDHDASRLERHGAAVLLVCLAPVLKLASLVVSYTGAATLGDTPVEISVGLTVALVYGFGATFLTVGFIYRVLPRTPLDRRTTMRGALIAAASTRCCR